MPPDISGSFAVAALSRACTVLLLLLCTGAALLALPQNTHAALADGLVGYWSFNGPDVTDKVYDRSAQGNHGYFNGGSTSSAKTIGKLGQALSFDGTATWANIDDSSVYDF